MRKTTNYGLSLYDKEDMMNITSSENSLNANMEIIDSKLKEIADKPNSGGGTNNNITSYLKTLKCGVLGDSITYGFGVNTETECYPMLLKEDFKEVINYGISSTLVAKDDRYPNPMCERYKNMADDLDVIIVMGGTNDFAQGSRKEGTFGEPTSTDPYTFYGALNILMSGLIEKYPGKEIFFCTPIHIAYGGYNSDTVKTNGKTLYDYRNAIIERGIYYSIPVIDTMGASGMDIAHNSKARVLFTTDGCHPNANGHQRLHDRIINSIKNMINKQVESESDEPEEPDTPTATLESISAFFTQGDNVIYTTDDLGVLKQYLVVNGIYSDGTSQVITDYTLNGTLEEGTSTITVTYSGITTTFTVDVTYKVPVELESITATFNQGENIIYPNNTLEDLKQYLVVTANYTDGTSSTALDYTLSGSLTVGTSVIIVEYKEKTTTFNVNVTAEPTLVSIEAIYSQGDNVIYTTDSLDTLKKYLTVNAVYDNGIKQVVTDYILSGELNEGSNTITVSYNEKVTTFEVVAEVMPPYTLYNSLTSDKDSYIDTGVMANQDTKFEIKYNLNNATGSQGGYGTGIGVLAAYSQNSAYFGLTVNSNEGYYCYGNVYPKYSLGDTTEDKVATNEKGTLYINGEQVVSAGDKTFTQSHPLYMFALNNVGKIEYKTTKLKIYYCKIWDGDTLIRDFVPAKRTSDGAIGMLDNVNNVFYENQGTGTFGTE
jgi:lysophospholipase L1-like esterase